MELLMLHLKSKIITLNKNYCLYSRKVFVFASEHFEAF